ncbi:MAG: TonB-dependent receptor, partial [Ignavibacteriaceae bacterium]
MDGNGIFETGPIVVPKVNLIYNVPSFKYSKSYAFINDKIKFISNRLLLNIGARYDYFSYSKAGNVSPRFSATYFLTPNITSINFAWGIYYQTQPYPVYADRYYSGINRNLLNTKAIHYVLGFEHIFDKGLKLNFEGYYKTYSNIPYGKEFIHFDDRTFRSEQKVNIGKMYAYGLDFV